MTSKAVPAVGCIYRQAYMDVLCRLLYVCKTQHGRANTRTQLANCQDMVVRSLQKNTC